MKFREVRQACAGFGAFGAAFMRLKLPPLGVVRPAYVTEPSFLEGPERPASGGRSPGSGSEAHKLPGLSPLSQAATLRHRLGDADAITATGLGAETQTLGRRPRRNVVGGAPNRGRDSVESP